MNGNKLADLALEVSRYQMRQSEDEVALTVERYYWQWISLHEKLRDDRDRGILGGESL